MDIKHTPLEKSESSSTISIGQFEGFHDKTDTGFKNLTKKCHIPFRDQDEFSAKLNSKVASCSVSASLESGLSFIRHNIYTIDELTEDSGLSFAKVRRTTSSEDELMQRLEKLKQVTTAARAVRRPVSRKGPDMKPNSSWSTRLNYREVISAKFDLMERFLKDQQEEQQDVIGSDESTGQPHTKSRPVSEKNRVISKLCCSCVSGQ
ncbi:uncharacterized protein LOC129732192 isoform X1 [Wyeomyia smithii]|uniref:uncharacterized protein LOC129732192 isoform X1 n=1 Tax=Wyeomyia smithii TaxID=174621 RepID=UPI002467E2FA|nr:uncharacterized protein LOC129732192 isoform X1 [Wyeomyia smithii]